MKGSKRAVKVIERIKELSLTNRAVAQFIGVDERSVYRWLSYDREPKLTFVQVSKLCEILQWSIHDLADAYYSDQLEPGASASN